MKYWHISSVAILLIGLSGHAINAYGQAAGAGADYNKADRARVSEQQRLERVDPPIRPDPVGNALIGGAVTGSMKGAAAGAASAVRGAATGSAIQGIKDDIRTNTEQNKQSGRGGPSDPRYNPGTLLGR
jgi:hypothetical protein